MNAKDASNLGFWLMLVLSLIVAHTCVRVEILNVRAGNFLPRGDLDRPCVNPKWRERSKRVAEGGWRRRRCLRILDVPRSAEEKLISSIFNSRDERPLSADERQELQKLISETEGDFLGREDQLRKLAAKVTLPLSSEEGVLLYNLILYAPLSSDEEKELEADKARAEANSALFGWVGSFGQLQYLLAPIALILAVAQSMLRIRWRRIAAIICTCTTVLSIVLMFYRGYFSSLGE